MRNDATKEGRVRLRVGIRRDGGGVATADPSNGSDPLTYSFTNTPAFMKRRTEPAADTEFSLSSFARASWPVAETLPPRAKQHSSRDRPLAWKAEPIV
jgi:hypothetical protein